MEAHLFPVASFVQTVLVSRQDPEGSDTTLHFSDLKKVDPAELFRLAHWLSRKVKLLFSGLAKGQLNIDASPQVLCLFSATIFQHDLNCVALVQERFHTAVPGNTSFLHMPSFIAILAKRARW